MTFWFCKGLPYSEWELYVRVFIRSESEEMNEVRKHPKLRWG